MRGHAVDLGYLAEPADAPVGGLVLIHDVWGLQDHYRELSDRLADEGFSTLAIDLYREMGKLEIADPGAWMRELSDPNLLDDIQRAVDHIAELCGGAVGVLGFCMGGSYALLAGCGLNRVAAVAPFYGILSHSHGLLHDPAGLDPAKKPRQPLDAARELRCPLMGFFGRDDPYVPVADVEELERNARNASGPTTIEIYEGAGHAFMNDTRPDAFRPETAAVAWPQMVSFFREHLA